MDRDRRDCDERWTCDGVHTESSREPGHEGIPEKEESEICAVSPPVVTHHAKQRGKQRFKLRETDLRGIAEACERGEGTFVEVRHGKEFWIMEISGREVPVVWNPENNALLTVLPKHALRHLHRSL